MALVESLPKATLFSAGAFATGAGLGKSLSR